MKSNKVTAIATSVIAICAVGFVFNGIYNSPTNREARCWKFQEEQIKKGPPKKVSDEWTKEEWESAIRTVTKGCVKQARR